MRTADMARMALGGLLDRRTRTLLTILGIAIGAAMLVALVSSNQGQTKAVGETLERLGPTTLVVRATGEQPAKLTAAEARRIEASPSVELAIPMFAGTGKLERGGEAAQVNVLGLDPALIPRIVPGIEFSDGRLMGPNDLTRIVLGASAADPPTGEPLVRGAGDVVRLTVQRPGEERPDARGFLVAAIAAPYGAAPFVDIDNAVVLAPPAAKALLGLQDENQFIVFAASPDLVDDAQDELQERYGDTARVFSARQIVQAVQTIFAAIGAIFGSIAGISLIVAGVGIANTMFVTVLERTQEIGVLKSLGFRSTHVLGIILLEALLTGFLGGITGCALGVGLAFAIGDLVNPANLASEAEFPDESGSGVQPDAFSFSSAPLFTAELFVLALLFAVIVSALAGVIPARRAARLDPVTALRSM